VGFEGDRGLGPDFSRPWELCWRRKKGEEGDGGPGKDYAECGQERLDSKI